MDGPKDYHTNQSKSERERQILYDITYMWNLKYNTNEHTSKAETDSQMYRTDYGCQGGGGGEGRDEISGLAEANYCIDI